MGFNSNLKVPFFKLSMGELSHSMFDFVWGSDKRPNSTMLPYLILKSYLRFSNYSSSSQYCVHTYVSFNGVFWSHGSSPQPLRIFGYPQFERVG